MARQDVADGGGARERLVDLHRRAAGVGEDCVDALPFEGLNEDIGPLAGLIRAESGDEIAGHGGFRQRRWCFGGDISGGAGDGAGMAAAAGGSFMMI